MKNDISGANQWTDIDMRSKSMDWFLYDSGLRRERVKLMFLAGFTKDVSTWCNMRNRQVAIYLFILVCKFWVSNLRSSRRKATFRNNFNFKRKLGLLGQNFIKVPQDIV